MREEQHKTKKKNKKKKERIRASERRIITVPDAQNLSEHSGFFGVDGEIRFVKLL